jgi:hypothetical protein
MLASALIALAVAPWTHPLAFQPLPGWQTERSGNVRADPIGNNRTATALESAAWMARGVRYDDVPTADPPNRTLQDLPRRAVIVWAVISDDGTARQRDPIRLNLALAKRFACCEAARVAGGQWKLSGAGPGHAYSAIVRVFFGSPPTAAMRKQAQVVLNQLQLPSSR